MKSTMFSFLFAMFMMLAAVYTTNGGKAVTQGKFNDSGPYTCVSSPARTDYVGVHRVPCKGDPKVTPAVMGAVGY